MSESSQCANILRWLKRGFAITPYQALSHFGCMRLAARIRELRQRGNRIDTRMLKLSSGKRVARYVLTKAA